MSPRDLTCCGYFGMFRIEGLCCIVMYVGTDRRTDITQFFCTLLKGTNSKVSSKRLISQVLNYQFIHVFVQPLLWGADRLILTKLPVTWESERGCCTVMEIPFSRVCRKRFNLLG